LSRDGFFIEVTDEAVSLEKVQKTLLVVSCLIGRGGALRSGIGEWKFDPSKEKKKSFGKRIRRHFTSQRMSFLAFLAGGCQSSNCPIGRVVAVRCQFCSTILCPAEPFKRRLYLFRLVFQLNGLAKWRTWQKNPSMSCI